MVFEKMKLIKKIFPNYVSKKELKRQLEFLCKQKFEIKKANTQKIMARMVVDPMFQITTEFIYDTLSHELSKEIKKMMNVEKIDSDNNARSIYFASIEVVERWE